MQASMNQNRYLLVVIPWIYENNVKSSICRHCNAKKDHVMPMSFPRSSRQHEPPILATKPFATSPSVTRIILAVTSIATPRARIVLPLLVPHYLSSNRQSFISSHNVFGSLVRCLHVLRRRCSCASVGCTVALNSQMSPIC